MSTANFGTPNYNLPLICGGLDYEEKKKRYEKDCGNEYNEDIFNSDVEWEFKEMKEEVEMFNDGLKHFEVYLEDGYYEGYMFNARCSDKYYDYDMLDDLTDDEVELVVDELENCEAYVEAHAEDWLYWIKQIKKGE